MLSTLRRSRRTLWHIALPSLWVTASAISLNDNLVEITSVTGDSMSPTLSPDQDTTGRSDYIAWNKWDASGHVQRGDIVFFGLPNRPEDTGVKRVIGVEGDVVVLDARRRPKSGNGNANGNTNPTAGSHDVPESKSWDAWSGRAKVPEGHVWVEGDNWRKSKDSNWYGPISRSLILGKAMAVVLPTEKFGAKPWEGFASGTTVVRERVDTRTDLEVLEAMGTAT
ncbi:hypothetical protein LTR36_007812 [Oleoguttula mirabilis]|uniref:Mitochondrial inner membrane protease subunit n=1 Tax=Oleoguttula mirabilis TaxID=1507867 RepID=A0AAV9J980_9PEZI|nr:hypothetical protein LTR36_007812 [Oleoguttula mirabilis]